MQHPQLAVVYAGGVTIWRVGRAPDPWSWVDHQYAGKQRWDDSQGVFRTIYAADSLYACYVEILACFRPDLNAGGRELLADIIEDPADATEYPTPPAGIVPRDWVNGRIESQATLTGAYVDVRASGTIAALRPRFLTVALQLGFEDFDAAAIKSAYPRDLTQQLATHIYGLVDDESEPRYAGVRFASRHGDELAMLAIFERPGDEPSSCWVERQQDALVDLADPALAAALTLHGLRWDESIRTGHEAIRRGHDR